MRSGLGGSCETEEVSSACFQEPLLPPPRHGFSLEDYMSPECALMSVEFLFSRADLKQSSRYRRQTLCLEVCCCCDVQGHSDGEGMSLVLASLSSAFYTCDSKIL